MIRTAALIKAFERGTADMNDHDDTIKYFMDTLSVATVLGTIVNMLPAIAAVFTIIWTAIRIYETDTVQRWVRKNDE
jgi:hypothetical protein